MADKVSIRAQAKHEGVSPSLIHVWRKKGMPADLDGGTIWRKRHTPGAGKSLAPLSGKGKSAYAKPATKAGVTQREDKEPDIEQQAKDLAERPEEIIAGEASCLETLEDLRVVTRFAKSQIAACHKRQEEAAARQWTQTFNVLASRKQILEKKYREILDRDGKTMSFEVAELTYRRVLQDIRQKLLAAPAALAAQLNPADPLHAQSVMEGWIKTLFKSIHENKEE